MILETSTLKIPTKDLTVKDLQNFLGVVLSEGYQPTTLILIEDGVVSVSKSVQKHGR